MTPEMAAQNDPSAHVAAITSPVLVIHGDKDYRVPIGEGLRLWFELNQQVKDPATSPHRFLYFPDENHWILSPQHSIGLVPQRPVVPRRPRPWPGRGRRRAAEVDGFRREVGSIHR